MANWYVYSGATGTATGADWTNAKTTLTAGVTGIAAGDTVYVAQDHVENNAAATTITVPGTAVTPCYIYCANRLGSVPPVAADLATTAQVNTTLTNTLTINGVAYIYGIKFSAGTAGNIATINIGTLTTSSQALRFDSCQFILGGAGTTSAIILGPASLQTVKVEWVNCGLTFNAVTQTLSLRNAELLWRDTAAPLLGAIYPTTLLSQDSTAMFSHATLRSLDLSVLSTGKTLVGAFTSVSKVYFIDCKLNATLPIFGSNAANYAGQNLHFIRCAGSADPTVFTKYAPAATQNVALLVGRSQGASDGANVISWKITATANARWHFPYESAPISNFSEVRASATITIEGAYDGATLPLNDEIWMDVDYLPTSTSTLASKVSGTKATGLSTGAALTATTSAWDTRSPARANSTAYVVGAPIKLASNAGRLFICITAGTTAATEPAGYASAVDGGSVTDGTATFRAAVRFKQTLNLSGPQLRGLLYATIKVAKANATYYIDPKLTLA